ncbi:MAG: hypothetical protein LUQ07_08225 [Methanospirillum sp.]|nr:hypothetical protein [Methanospirillum sp.]
MTAAASQESAAAVDQISRVVNEPTVSITLIAQQMEHFITENRELKRCH